MPSEPPRPLPDVTGTPAERFRFADGIAEIGLILSVTKPLCGTYSHLRLTADSAVRNCLFTDEEGTARNILRNDGTDAELSFLLRAAVWTKNLSHGINQPGFLSRSRSMSMIGG
jgi:cyclic pyranopterin phosphate synthase